ncbi:hypothetical protein ACO22_07897, partial [Paracoccidioides brasiliensis]
MVASDLPGNEVEASEWKVMKLQESQPAVRIPRFTKACLMEQISETEAA